MPSVDYRQLVPLQQLNAANIEELLSKSHRECLPRKQRVDASNERNWFVYLISGEIDLDEKNKPGKRVFANDLRAHRPIFTGNCTETSFVAVNNCTFLKVDRKHFENLMGEQSASGIQVESHATVDGDNQVVQQIFSDYRQGKIQTPSLPELAMRVKGVADDDDATINELSALIQTDPAMSGKIVFAANSVAFRGHRELKSIRDAVIRLGMKKTRNLVISFSINELFKARKPHIRKHLLDNWEHSVLTAAYGQFLAEQTKSANPEQIFLLGLLHNIGAMTLLAYIEANGEIAEITQVAAILAQMRRFVGVLVLQRWEMPDEYVTVAENAGKFDAIDPSQQIALDLINLAKYQTWHDQGRGHRLPEISSLPGFQRQHPGEIDEDGKLQLLSDRAQETRDLLGALS